MDLLQTRYGDCPYCGEVIELVLDASVAQQDYVEDCFVCCQPIRVLVDASDPEFPSMQLLSQDDA